MEGANLFDWSSLLPPYLLDSEKDRLSKALKQFKRNSSESGEIDYSGFYLSNPPQILLQGDLIVSAVRPFWNVHQDIFESMYSRVLLISNSCDVSSDNKRNIQKDAVFAPIIPFSEYEKDMEEKGFSRIKIDSVFMQIKRQSFSNLFFLPNPNGSDSGYIVLLDQLFSLPNSEVEKMSNNLITSRFKTLDNFGSYLLIVKLSFHFCRVPEEVERRSV